MRECHSQRSLPVLDEILNAFRRGDRGTAEGWRRDGQRFMYTRYHAVRDADGAYRGGLEINQDVAPLRFLEGERKLPGW